MPHDYSKTIIYKITIEGTDLIYIGHTTTTIPQRLVYHMRQAKLYPNRKVYKAVTENGGWDNIKIEKIRDHPCATFREAKLEEDREMQQYFGTERSLNTNVAVRDLKKYNHEHYEKHKEEHLKKNKEYYETHKDEIKQKQKEYIAEHKEHIAQKKQEWAERNRERVKANQDRKSVV